MIGDALRGYLSLASGLTEVTRARAGAAARALVAQGELTRAQATALAEDLMRTSRANREALVAVVRQEIDRAINRAGLAGAEQVDALDRRLRAVERKLATAPVARAGAGGAGAGGGAGGASTGAGGGGATARKKAAVRGDAAARKAAGRPRARQTGGAT